MKAREKVKFSVKVWEAKLQSHNANGVCNQRVSFKKLVICEEFNIGIMSQMSLYLSEPQVSILHNEVEDIYLLKILKILEIMYFKCLK